MYKRLRSATVINHAYTTIILCHYMMAVKFPSHIPMPVGTLIVSLLLCTPYIHTLHPDLSLHIPNLNDTLMSVDSSPTLSRPATSSGKIFLATGSSTSINVQSMLCKLCHCHFSLAAYLDTNMELFWKGSYLSRSWYI